MFNWLFGKQSSVGKKQQSSSLNIPFANNPQLFEKTPKPIGEKRQLTRGNPYKNGNYDYYSTSYCQFGEQGLRSKDIAHILGIYPKNGSEPKTQVVNLALRTVNYPQIGSVQGVNYVYKSGGSNNRYWEFELYDHSAVDAVKNFLNNNAVQKAPNLYYLGNIPFTIYNMADKTPD